MADPQPVCFVRGKRLAQGARHHRALATDHNGQEVGRTADRRRTVFGPGLAEIRQILRHAEIASHADFLATAYPHAVDAAHDRFVASQDGRHHVVEQPHVLAVFLRVTSIILSVLFGIAASAERLVAAAREHDGIHVACVRGRTKREDHAFDHSRRVGVVLFRVVQSDPDVV